MRGLGARAATLAACFSGLLLAFFLVARPWYRSWGADGALRTAPLPGDSLLWQGTPRETRAVLIHAPASHVWPWVAQIGQDRAGFYSYEILENLVGCKMKNLDYLIPALQHWQEGDKLWMYPPDRAGGIGQAPLARFDPGHALVFYTRRPGTALTDQPDGTWAFVVEPVDGADVSPHHAGPRTREPGASGRQLRAKRLRADSLRDGAEDDGGHQDCAPRIARCRRPATTSRSCSGH